MTAAFYEANIPGSLLATSKEWRVQRRVNGTDYLTVAAWNVIIVFPHYKLEIIEHRVAKFGTHDDPEAPSSGTDSGSKRSRSNGSKVKVTRLKSVCFCLSMPVSLTYFVDVHYMARPYLGGWRKEVVSIGADFVLVLTEESGANVTFCPGKGPILILKWRCSNCINRFYKM